VREVTVESDVEMTSQSKAFMKPTTSPKNGDKPGIGDG